MLNLTAKFNAANILFFVKVDGLCGEYTYSNEDPVTLTEEILESFALGECKNDCEIGDDSCGENAHCSDIDGTNACICDDGYTGDGKICEGTAEICYRKSDLCQLPSLFYCWYFI